MFLSGLKGAEIIYTFFILKYFKIADYVLIKKLDCPSSHSYSLVYIMWNFLW